MKTIFKLFILAAAIFCVAFVPTAGNHVFASQTCGSAQTQTFNFYADEPSDYQCIRPGVNGASGWCATNIVADQFCKTKGFDSSTTFASNPSGWGGTIYNDCGINWNGSSFYVEPITHTGRGQTDCPAWATSITCTKGTTTCGANQICQNNQCVDQHITCSSNTDCGNNAYTGSPSCQGNSVYQNYKTYVCSNPGTATSSCSNSTAPQFVNNCAANQTCSGGVCVDQNVTKTADLSIAKSGPSTINRGQVISYTVTVTNHGPDTATGVTVGDTVPAGLTFNAGASSPTCSSGVYSSLVTCNQSSLNNNQSTSFTIAFNVPTLIACNTVLENVAATSSAENDPNTSNNHTTIVQGPVRTTVQCPQVACSSNTDCGNNAYTGSPSCQGNSVYQNYITYTCLNPGTANSTCSNSTASQLKNNCTGNQTCSGGSCLNQNIACSSNTDCGNNAYTGSPSCQGNSVYQNYITYTCLNPGTANSTCSNSTASQLKNNCTGNQTCSGGSCGTNCSTHSYQQCNGSYLYWYDSCGNQQDSQFCQNGCSGNSCQNYNYINSSVQTSPATNVYNNQVTLNGYLYNNNNNNDNNYNNNYCISYVFFQWGPTISYGNETIHQQQNYSGAFSQIVNLNNTYNGYNNYNNGAYHVRAVATLCQGGTVYGQDMAFYSNNNNNNGNSLTVSKTVKNLSNGSGFASSTYAAPGDMVMFMITLPATGGQDVQNVFVRDSFPSNLIYKNQLVVACTSNNGNNSNCNNNNYNYSGDITSGINLGTVYAGQTVTITYQAQLAPAQNFSYGATTLNNSVSVTSSGTGYNPTSNASVIVTRSAVYGASTISTGLTNNFWVDSFFLPLLITLILLWIWKSGMLFGIEKWLFNQKSKSRDYKAERELADRIALIRRTEKI
jgi:uncharacterized repeat protein (TIGR01451 family)